MKERCVENKHNKPAYIGLLVSITVALSLCTIYSIHYSSLPSDNITPKEREEYNVHPVYHYERDLNGNRRLMAHIEPDAKETNESKSDSSFSARLSKRLINAFHTGNIRKKDEFPRISYDAFRKGYRSKFCCLYDSDIRMHITCFLCCCSFSEKHQNHPSTQQTKSKDAE